MSIPETLLLIGGCLTLVLVFILGLGYILVRVHDRQQRLEHQQRMMEIEGERTMTTQTDNQHVQALANMLIACHAHREPDLKIGPPGDPYLLRWHVSLSNDSGRIYLHHILHDDDDRALHDHPWESVSLVLRGTLREVLPYGHQRLLTPGSITHRDARQPHRLELVDGNPVWTLFLTGTWERDWGFHCPDGWVYWRDFVDANGTGIGKGCGQ